MTMVGCQSLETQKESKSESKSHDYYKGFFDGANMVKFDISHGVFHDKNVPPEISVEHLSKGMFCDKSPSYIDGFVDAHNSLSNAVITGTGYYNKKHDN